MGWGSLVLGERDSKALVVRTTPKILHWVLAQKEV